MWSTCHYELFFHYWKSFVFRWPCLYYTFLSLFGCNHMFKSFFEATGKNVWIIVLFFSKSHFWLKITLCGFTFRYGPFFQYWNSFTFRWPCLYYTFLSLSGCNHMFKSFFEATGKNVWAVVLFFSFKIQNFGWKSLFVDSHLAMGPFFSIEIHLHFGGHVFITLF